MIRMTVIIVALSFCLVQAGPARAGDAAAEGPRIVSFSPALTRILFDMNLGHHVVGVTRFCRLPDGIERPRIGDAESISAETILAVRPDIILTQSLPERFRGVTDADPRVKVVAIPIVRLDDVPVAIERIGEVVGQPELAAATRDAFLARLASVRRSVAAREPVRVLFVMGTDRPTAFGPDNFVHDLIELAGGTNAGADVAGTAPWRPTHIDAIVATAPDVIVCHVPSAQADRARAYWLQWSNLPAARAGRVVVMTDPDWLRPSMRLAELAAVLAEKIHPDLAGATTAEVSLWRARLLRWLAAAVVGAGLAIGGMALQGLLRNPLADPYILGVSSGAGVGVLLGMAAAASWSALPEWASTPALAFVGALVTCAVVYALAQRSGRLDPYTLILAGVIANTFNGAIMLAIYLYVDVYRIAEFTHWAMGRLPDSVDVRLLIMCGGLVIAGGCVLLWHAAAANVLTLGDQVAASTGVAVGRLRIVTFTAVGLMTAAAVALAGPIGFVGLIVPHICRMIVGPDQRIGLATSAVAGAVLLVLAEGLCRWVGPMVNVSLVPVGILTALTGGPFFVVLLRRQRGKATV